MTWPSYTKACRAEIDSLLRKGGSLSAYRANPQVGVGPKEGSQAWRLEREIEKKFGVKHAVAVNSGTAALHAALHSVGVHGGEVIVSPYTFSATVSAIVLAGGTPVFADVDPYTFCITPETVKPCITKRTAAIVPVHLFGYFQDVSGFMDFGVPVVEDACQAVGASRAGRFAGTIGTCGAYSFNGGKNVPAGEGGALITNSSEIAEKARRFVNHAENFGSKAVGYNYRMHELVACLARHGLKGLDERNKRRRALAGEFNTLRHIDMVYAGVKRTHDEPEGSHVFYCYPFMLDRGINRAKFIKRCAEKGLTVGAGYITPSLEKYPAFRRYATSKLPVVTELSEKTLALIYDFTPDKPLSYAAWAAKIVREALA